MRDLAIHLARYTVAGVSATVVNIGTYLALTLTVLNPTDAFQLQVANVVSWTLSVIVAYVMNRRFVFKSTREKVAREAAAFIGGRALTLALDMAVMFVGVSVLHRPDKLVKALSLALVTIGNYAFSRLIVFRSVDAPSLRK